ncbi:MAG TPA: hypothetical protein VIG73_11830, partial [Cerasibacillus sp.]|uniref:hypothetical protein n=1 Tax=Cerasibacillus sp. TaxID=2498711 RepID=UPI002F42B265
VKEHYVYILPNSLAKANRNSSPTYSLVLFAPSHSLRMGDFFRKVVKKEHIRDISQYHKQQSLLNLSLGIVFLLVPLSIYAVEMYSISPQWLYGWLIVLAILMFLNIRSVRNNRKEY